MFSKSKAGEASPWVSQVRRVMWASSQFQSTSARTRASWPAASSAEIQSRRSLYATRGLSAVAAAFALVAMARLLLEVERVAELVAARGTGQGVAHEERVLAAEGHLGVLRDLEPATRAVRPDELLGQRPDLASVMLRHGTLLVFSPPFTPVPGAAQGTPARPPRPGARRASC